MREERLLHGNRFIGNPWKMCLRPPQVITVIIKQVSGHILPNIIQKPLLPTSKLKAVTGQQSPA